MKLIPVQQGGIVTAETGKLPPAADEALEGITSLYNHVGFAPPWICYIAILNGVAVGTCGFKSAPAKGRVEIAYFTFPAFEGRGVATEMAANLILIAEQFAPTVIVAAQTLPERGASHRVLEKNGFVCTGSLEHPEDGTVLEWQKPQHVI